MSQNGGHSNFEDALKWSHKVLTTNNNPAMQNQPANNWVSPDWSKLVPDITLGLICLTVIIISIYFMIKGWNRTNTSPIAQNPRPSSISQNAIPILY